MRMPPWLRKHSRTPIGDTASRPRGGMAREERASPERQGFPGATNAPGSARRVNRRYEDGDGLGEGRGASGGGGAMRVLSWTGVFRNDEGFDCEKRDPRGQRWGLDPSQMRRDDEHGVVVVVVIEEATDPERIWRIGIGQGSQRYVDRQQREQHREQGETASHSNRVDICSSPLVKPNDQLRPRRAAACRRVRACPAPVSA
jgi:hypothetical protein